MKPVLVANAGQVGIAGELAHAHCAALHEPAQDLERRLALPCGRDRGRGGQSDAASARRSQDSRRGVWKGEQGFCRGIRAGKGDVPAPTHAQLWLNEVCGACPCGPVRAKGENEKKEMAASLTGLRRLRPRAHVQRRKEDRTHGMRMAARRPSVCAHSSRSTVSRKTKCGGDESHLAAVIVLPSRPLA